MDLAGQAHLVPTPASDSVNNFVDLASLAIEQCLSLCSVQVKEDEQQTTAAAHSEAEN